MEKVQLDRDKRDALVLELMMARRAVRTAGADPVARTDARRRVDNAKIALGDRGPVWWADGEPDYNRHLVKNTAYARWYEGLADWERGYGG